MLYTQHAFALVPLELKVR